MKKGIRILGIDDAPFSKSDKQVLVVGVVWRNGLVEGIVSTRVERDGSDAAEKLVEMIGRTRFKEGLRLILTQSLTLAGFNIIDIRRLNEKTGVPVITIVRRKPGLKGVRKALEKVPGGPAKWRLVEKAGPVVKLGRFYAQFAGIDEKDAGRALKQFGTEPVRLAHIIASGVIKGESKGRI